MEIFSIQPLQRWKHLHTPPAQRHNNSFHDFMNAVCHCKQGLRIACMQQRHKKHGLLGVFIPLWLALHRLTMPQYMMNASCCVFADVLDSLNVTHTNYRMPRCVSVQRELHTFCHAGCREILA